MFAIASAAVIVPISAIALISDSHNRRRRHSAICHSVADNDVVCIIGVFKKAPGSAAIHRTEKKDDLFIAILLAKLEVEFERANPTQPPPAPRPPLIPLPDGLPPPNLTPQSHTASVSDLERQAGQEQAPTIELAQMNNTNQESTSDVDDEDDYIPDPTGW